MALTPKEQRFVEEYLLDLNGAQAAIRAGYSAKGANSKAAQLLAKVSIAEAVAIAQTARSTRTQITADRVLQELARLGFSDARKLFRPDGSLKPAAEWDDETAAAVAGIDVVEMAGGAKIGGAEGIQHVPMYTKKLKLWDKNSALEKIAKHLGMFIERVEHSGSIDLSSATDEQLRARIKELAAKC